MSDNLVLHPLVRQMIRKGTRDKPLTLNWVPIERDAYDCLKLPDLSPLQIRARTQIITELLVAGNRSVSYSRNRNHYCALQRYYPETYSYRAIVPAVDQLDAWGLIEHDKRIPGGRGLQSRLRPSTDLLEQLANVQVIYKPMEIIILRDSAGNPIGYVDNRETRQMRKRMTAINEAIAAQRVGLGERIIREGDRLDNGGRAQMQMHRVFVRGSWDNCGRLVGSFWQNLPKPERSTLTINGHSTVEVDYAGMHIRLLYDMVGKLMPGDPYDIDRWPRGQVKVALLIAINARTHRSAVRALADALRLEGVANPFEAANKLVNAAKAKHPDIAWAFGSDAGVRLMRRDSEIAQQVILEMLRATGIAPLAIHDSFVVPAAHEDRLREAMENAFPCKNATAIIPCKNAPQNRDMLSPRILSGNLQNDLTLWDGERGRVEVRPGGDRADGSGLSLTEYALEIVHGQLDELERRRARREVRA